jgi:glycosyltransferase involved in cell wall biosynthesis
LILGMPTAVSLCMLVKNEALNLARCLDSVRGLAAECILVDTGSTDATPFIAAGYGARIIPFDFTRVDFAAARNHALARAQSPWILVLDADETLDGASARTLRRLVALNQNAGYLLERHNHSSDAEPSDCGPVARDYVVRLFPNRPEYRYRGRVHETIDASILAAGGLLQKSGIVIHHRFSPDPEARRRKNRWYIEILKEEIAADPSDHSRLDFLAAEYHQLGMFDEAAEIAERIARLRPLDPRAHLFVGVYHFLHLRDLARARAAFEHALQLRPEYPEAESFLKRLEEARHAQGL